jgi:hypothetical protein
MHPSLSPFRFPPIRTFPAPKTPVVVFREVSRPVIDSVTVKKRISTSQYSNTNCPYKQFKTFRQLDIKTQNSRGYRTQITEQMILNQISVENDFLACSWCERRRRILVCLDFSTWKINGLWSNSSHPIDGLQTPLLSEPRLCGLCGGGGDLKQQRSDVHSLQLRKKRLLRISDSSYDGSRKSKETYASRLCGCTCVFVANLVV